MGPAGDDRTAQVAQGLFEHQAGRGQLIVEGVLHGITGTEAHGIEGFGVAPVVFATVFEGRRWVRGEEDALQIPDVLGQQTAQTQAHGLQEDEFLFLEDGDVLDIGQGLELLHVELRAVEAFFDVFRSSGRRRRAGP